MDKWAAERAVAHELFRTSGMTQEEWAVHCGISQAAASGILNGKRGGKVTYNRIARAYGFEYKDYFKKDDVKEVEREMGHADMTAALIQRLIEEVADLKRWRAEHEDHHPYHGRPRNKAGR